MNDRFDLQLRQHLLKTADDRPAAGQLAAIVERVAARAQRRPIVARLVFPGRLGSAPSTSLGYAFIALALIGALLAAAALGAGAPRPVPAATSPAPTASSEPLRSPAPGFSTFESTVHGISIDYPAGWQTRPATTIARRRPLFMRRSISKRQPPGTPESCFSVTWTTENTEATEANTGVSR